MTTEEKSAVVEELWRSLRFTKAEIEEVLTLSRLGPLQQDWAESPDALQLTLAWILRRATRIQARLCREVSPAEFKPVLTASRRLAFEIKKLQARDDPPPPIPINKKGRSPWEAWAHAAKGLSRLGARPRSDPEAVGHLVAYYQLAVGQEKAGFSNHHDAPLTRFLRASFNCAEARLLIWQAKNGYLHCRHSLHDPKPKALEGQLKRLGQNERNLMEVQKQFERFRRRISKAHAENK